MSSSSRVAISSAMAGPRAPRFAATLRKRRFGGAVTPRSAGFFRSILCTVMGELENPAAV
jgi:hypothetical protein